MFTLTARTKTMTTSSPISLPHLQGYTVLSEQIPDDNIVTYIAHLIYKAMQCSTKRDQTKTSSPISLTAIYSAVLTGPMATSTLEPVDSIVTYLNSPPTTSYSQGRGPLKIPQHGYFDSEDEHDDNIVTYIASSSTRLYSAQRADTR